MVVRVVRVVFQEVVRTARVWQACGGCTLNSSPSRTDMHAKATLALMRRHPEKFQTITSDNGTEFHSDAQIEAAAR
jgi:IS30 family transposase